MKNCPSCNSQLSDEAVFCNRCGARMDVPSQTTEPVAEMESIAVPIIDDQTFAQPKKPVQEQSFVQPAQPQGFSQQPQGFGQPVQGSGSFVQPSPYEQPQGFNNPNYIDPASAQMPGVTPGKKGSSLIVPIILIILILAVICIDVFWLFKDQIWGKKDDSSTSAANCIIMIDE